MPLVCWPFRGLSEDERRAFMFTNVIDVEGRKYASQCLPELWRRRGKSTSADRCHAEMGLSAGVFRRASIWSAPSSFGTDSRPKLKPQDPWVSDNLGLWSDED